MREGLSVLQNRKKNVGKGSNNSGIVDSAINNTLFTQPVICHMAPVCGVRLPLPNNANLHLMFYLSILLVFRSGNKVYELNKQNTNFQNL